ncbi:MULTISPECIES: hypothetical protein [unclassified Mycobacterium]|uniref:hypothetical protein n=1 Tax=unclassified Mycobacterium TaxID=2642494 RepID=UPI0029C75B4A|nr:MULTISPECIES: hypothetical protein [unclassified Mycobacterium]
MKLVAESGLWTTGPAVAAAPAVAVLEVSGAVFAWTVDDPSAEAVHVTFTNIAAAEWLWRVVGEDGHVRLLAALDTVPEAVAALDVPEAELSPAALAPLRQLAVGHWLRRWWPASARDGIVGLDPVVLDGELALLTSAAQDFFTEDTFDSDVAELLRPHRAELAERMRNDDPKVAELAEACAELADEFGVPSADLAVSLPNGLGRRDDYALAAGSDGAPTSKESIATGVGSVNWVAVPPGMFDAADRTVDWTVERAGSSAVAAVRVATNASAGGIEVRLRSGTFSAAGVLDADGRATLPLFGSDQRPVSETQAWDHDWRSVTVTVGADVVDSAEAAQLRARLRDFARARLARPGEDALLAEVLAAESDY